jgi:DNA-binding transcriptional LysR family regulator
LTTKALRRPSVAALDANALELFARVAAAGSFAEAARQLGLTRAAVSRRVAAIEAVAGAALFARTTRSLGLTETGRRLATRARAVLDAAEAARHAVRAGRGALEGMLRVTAVPSFGRAALGPLLARFRAAHPGVRFELLVTERRVDLLREGVDVAFRITRRPPDDWVAQPVLRFAVRAFAAPRAGLPLAEPAALAGEPCLVFGAQGDMVPLAWRGASGQATVDVVPAVAGSELDTLLAIARAGGGIVFAPDYCVQADLAAGVLIDALPGWTLPVAEGDTVFALTLAPPAVSETARALVRFAAQALAN